jgi:Beta/Gamma crystallin
MLEAVVNPTYNIHGLSVQFQEVKRSISMNSKMQIQKSLEQQVRGKVARWAAVAVSVVGISVGMVMPAHALNRADCEPETFNIAQGPRGDRATMCFANAGEALVGIADVHRLYSGNNEGYVFTNKGTFRVGRHQVVDFINTVGTVNIHFIRIN